MHEVQPPGFVGVTNTYGGDPNVINVDLSSFDQTNLLFIDECRSMMLSVSVAPSATPSRELSVSVASSSTLSKELTCLYKIKT